MTIENKKCKTEKLGLKAAFSPVEKEWYCEVCKKKAKEEGVWLISGGEK